MKRALEERAYRQEGRRISYVQSSAALTEWKRTPELAFLNEVAAVPLQQAFANFFAQRARHPVFKTRKRSGLSAEYTRSGFRWRNGERRPRRWAWTWGSPLATLSTGEKIANPRHERELAGAALDAAGQSVLVRSRSHRR